MKILFYDMYDSPLASKCKVDAVFPREWSLEEASLPHRNLKTQRRPSRGPSLPSWSTTREISSNISPGQTTGPIQRCFFIFWDLGPLTRCLLPLGRPLPR